jgi:hypothetical protein
MGVQVSGGELVDFRTLGAPLASDGAEIAQFTVRASGDAHVHARIVLMVGVSHPLCAGREVIDLLSAIGGPVRAVIGDFADDF